MVVVSAAALGLLGLVFAFWRWILFGRDLWYGFYDISDMPVYFDYAQRMANGARPFRDFPVEYPPLAVPLFSLPGRIAGRTDDLWTYADRFAAEMLICVTIASVVLAVAGVSLWRGWRRPLAAVGVFALGVAFTGAIIANRYDAVVALLLAVVLLCLARGWWEGAAVVLGLGFALKLTPAILLPLVLLLARDRTRIGICCGFFAIAAFLPWLPYLPHGDLTSAAVWYQPWTWGADDIARWLWVPDWQWGDLKYVFTYHIDRPLQIESVLGTPHWIGHLVDRMQVDIGDSYGSQSLGTAGAGAGARAAGWLLLLASAVGGFVAWTRRAKLRGVAGPAVAGLLAVAAALGLGLTLAAESDETVAKASFWLMAAAMAVVYWLLWRRRESLRDDPRLVPLAVLALILAFMTFGKVLSPQYFIWTLPAIALVTVDRRTLGALALSVVLLTQIEFPDQYWQFAEYMEDPSVALVVFRNLTLVAAFAASVTGLARLPDAQVTRDKRAAR